MLLKGNAFHVIHRHVFYANKQSQTQRVKAKQTKHLIYTIEVLVKETILFIN